MPQISKNTAAVTKNGKTRIEVTDNHPVFPAWLGRGYDFVANKIAFKIVLLQTRILLQSRQIVTVQKGVQTESVNLCGI